MGNEHLIKKRNLPTADRRTRGRGRWRENQCLEMGFTLVEELYDLFTGFCLHSGP